MTDTSKERAALDQMALRANGLRWDEDKDTLRVALDELDARRAMDDHVLDCARWAGRVAVQDYWDSAQKLLSAPWLKGTP